MTNHTPPAGAPSANTPPSSTDNFKTATPLFDVGIPLGLSKQTLSVWAKTNLADPSDPSYLQLWQHLEDTAATASHVWDDFTAVDDVKQDSDEEGDAGAAMIGDVEFNSATFYRYANVDVDRLLDTLGDANATVQAVTAFIDAFSTTVPNGKINTFAHNTLPDLVVVNLRDTQAVNLAGAFERPIAGDVVANATKALVEREQEIDASYGTTPVHTWVIRVGKDTEAADQLAARQPLRDVLTELGDAIASRLVQE